MRTKMHRPTHTGKVPTSATFVFLAFVVVTNVPANVSPGSPACTNNCDISVVGFVPNRGLIKTGRVSVKFIVTFKNRNTGDRVMKVENGGYNVDCTMMFSDSGNLNITADDSSSTGNSFSAEDAVKFSNSTQCEVDKKSMKSGFDPLETKSLHGNCNMSIENIPCDKAKYICVDCPRPAGATYTADKNAKNNQKCVAIRKGDENTKNGPWLTCTADNSIDRLQVSIFVGILATANAIGYL